MSYVPVASASSHATANQSTSYRPTNATSGPSGSTMAPFSPVIGRLHVLTDFYFQQRFSHAGLAQLAIDGGADTVQFRQKKGGIRHQIRDARETAAVCARKGVPLIVDDRLDLVLATGAAGVHLGQTDFPVPDARRILPPDTVIGATATNVEQAQRAEEEGAHYIGFGPVYPTASKANPAAVKGIDGLREVCRAVSIPVIAIAGITPKRVVPVLEAGAHGIAVMTAVTTAQDPEQAAAQFRKAIDDFLD